MFSVSLFKYESWLSLFESELLEREVEDSYSGLSFLLPFLALHDGDEQQCEQENTTAKTYPINFCVFYSDISIIIVLS
jgi:hypothetical protein